MIEYADIFALRALDMLWLRDLYIPNVSQRSLPDASPLLQEDPRAFKDMAPAWVGVVELDVLRSEGEAYVEKLKDNGVPVTFKMYKGECINVHTILPLKLIHELNRGYPSYACCGQSKCFCECD